MALGLAHTRLPVGFQKLNWMFVVKEAYRRINSKAHRYQIQPGSQQESCISGEQFELNDTGIELRTKCYSMSPYKSHRKYIQ